MAVYDDQKELNELNKVTGADDNEDQNNTNSSTLDDNEASVEKDKLGVDSNDSNDESENSESSDSNDSAIKNNTSRKKGIRGKSKDWISNKTNQYITAAVVGLLSAVISSTVMFMPTFIINHLSEMLKGIGNVQIDYQRRYRRKYIHKVGDMFSKDGRRGSKIIAEMELRGYRAEFEGNTLKNLTRPGGNSPIPAHEIADELEMHLQTRHPLRSSRWKTKRMNAFYDRYKIPKRSVILAASGNIDESIDAIINRRIASTTLADDDVKINYNGESPAENETEADSNSRAAREAEAKNIIENDNSLNDLKKKLKEGTPISELSDHDRHVLKVGLTYDIELKDFLDNYPVNAGLASKIKGVFGSALLEAPDKICAIKSKTNAVRLATRVYRYRELVKYAAIFIANADQTRVGGASAGAINEVMKRVMREDSKERGIGASEGFKSMITGKFSKSRNDLAKNAYSVDGGLTGISKELNDSTDGMVGCSIVENPIAQVGAGVGELALGVVTGGGFKATLAAGKTAIKEGAEAGIKATVAKVLKSKVAKSIAASVVVELSFEGIMAYITIEAEKALSLNTTGQEVGGDLGDIISSGSGGLNKQRSLKAGLVPATTTQYQAALDDYKLRKQEEIKGKSFFARVFDYSDHDSLIFKSASLAVASPVIGPDIGTTTSNIAKVLATTPASLLNMTTSMLIPKSYAQDDDLIEFDSFNVKDTDINLATDFAGNVQTVMLKEIEDIDPEENIESLIATGDIESSEPYEPKSDEFKNHIINCVESEDSITSIEEYPNPTSPEYDCLAKLSLTKKYKAHLAYLDMVDGIESGLFPEEISDNEQSGTTTPDLSVDAVLPGEGLPWPLGQTRDQAKTTQGGCINESTQSVCHGGHPYLSHDLFAPQGTPVFSVTGGEVIHAKVGTCGHGHSRAFAVSVYNSESDTTYFYQHMDADVGGISKGAVVNPGDKIGVVGPTEAACNTPPHLHIDAGKGRGRKACSRKSCSSSVKANFVDISSGLYKGYDALN